ncbi:hypothetical protein [Sporichthya sp.]|uniref:hypothetical protein n=1 Tax=Sporichthya sp. TaxID=65475 RepID=UPI0017F73C22|nr:hypothetical protein [Sporichthya sp.]MBA3741710.1 hypothetical protein [Sporichthya sp.]
MAERTLRLVAPEQLATDWETAWADALITLELDVTRAERLLTDGTPAVAVAPRPDWVAPALSGPLPERLRARAEAIAARQLRLAEDLSRAVAAARQELRLAERIQAHALDRSTPAFLDASF